MQDKKKEEKILTRCDVKIELKEWAEDQGETFTTQEAADEIRQRAGKVHLNNNKIAQYLRGAAPQYEFHKGLRRWIKKRE